MLNIRRQHIEALGRGMRRRFVKECVAFLDSALPEASAALTADQKRQYVEAMIAFGHEYDIRKGRNLQKLMLYKAEHGFTVPLPAFHHERLSREDFDEDYRVEQFRSHLIAKSAPTPITLDSPLE